MAFRLGLVFGAAIGYVLGAKAGRERYEQISSMTRSLAGSEPAQQVGTEVRKAASRAGEVLETQAAKQVSKVTTRLNTGQRESPSDGPAGPRTVPPS